jgi:glucose-1-phosphate cytidylyltransferase
MKTVILAGGLGSRLSEETESSPKPMVEIGGLPILWHVMGIYAAHGFRDFVVACGYRGSQVKEYFRHVGEHSGDITVSLGSGTVQVHQPLAPDWDVTLVDTGLYTQTGGRLKRLAERLGGGTFMLTYGDGVADVDIGRLVAFHRAHRLPATLTAVRPPARFGALEFDGDRVAQFSEKPQAGEGWINGGFMVLEPEVLDRIAGDQTVLEREPLEGLAADGQLMAYRHDGFWHPMDTVRDRQSLERLWREGRAPWLPR